MPAVIITMLVILLIAAAIVAVVAMGMQGHAREVSPEFANAMARTAQHLNGDAEPPRGLVVIANEFDELPSPDVRQIPARIREMRSARSAASAKSALSAKSAASADHPDAETHESDAAADSTWAADGGALPEEAGVGDTVVHAELPRDTRTP